MINMKASILYILVLPCLALIAQGCANYYPRGYGGYHRAYYDEGYFQAPIYQEYSGYGGFGGYSHEYSHDDGYRGEGRHDEHGRGDGWRPQPPNPSPQPRPEQRLKAVERQFHQEERQYQQRAGHLERRLIQRENQLDRKLDQAEESRLRQMRQHHASGQEMDAVKQRFERRRDEESQALRRRFEVKEQNLRHRETEALARLTRQKNHWEQRVQFGHESPRAVPPFSNGSDSSHHRERGCAEKKTHRGGC